MRASNPTRIGDSDSRASSVEAAYAKNGAVVQVPAIDLASFMHDKLRWDDVNYMKIDIESGEYPLLPHLLAKSALCPLDFLLVEWHLNMVNATKRLEALSLRLVLTDLIEQGCPPRPRGPRIIEHDETQNARHVGVPGLNERARFHNGLIDAANPGAVPGAVVKQRGL